MNLGDYAAKIRKLRYDWIEDIPKEILQQGQYKVRKNWFQAISLNISIGIRKGYIPTEFRTNFVSFEGKFCCEDFRARITTKKDIDEGNQILDKILKYLVD